MTNKVKMRDRIPEYIKEITDGLEDEKYDVKVLLDDGNLLVFVLRIVDFRGRNGYTFYVNTFWSLQGFIDILETRNGDLDIRYHNGAWCEDVNSSEIAMVMSLSWSYVNQEIIPYHDNTK